jgi:Alw26I/Eco31I/Esp3I family type II restriction m6 adenine DNA methyltransferase
VLDILPSFAPDEAVYSGKTLAQRLTGCFYTPDALAADLADEMVRAFVASKAAPVIDLIDPFCGDGRLLAALLVRAADEPWLGWSKWRITLWDQDVQALAAAKRRLAELAGNLGLPVSISIRVGDSFAAYSGEPFDFVITNPPWELLKPDHRELAHLSTVQREQYRQRLRQVSDELDERFPNAKGAGAWGGWATNLARCGWDLSMRLLKRHGVLGIVLPSTIMGDQSSERLRRTAFTKYRLIDIAAYPPEARLFDRVDQPVVSVTLTANTQDDRPATLRVFDASKCQKSAVEIGDCESLARRGYAIPVAFGVTGGEILDRLRTLPKLKDSEGGGPTDLWLGRELDETRVSEKLVSHGEFPFVKGRMVNRHVVVEVPALSVRPEIASRFDSATRPRAVWRDVSRASQKRRMIGTVIPSGWVAGNSLHVACYRDGDLLRTQALHALLSSFVLEFQVRCRLATGHMSLGVVRDAHIPELDMLLVRRLSAAVRNLEAASETMADRLEVLVARAYGLDRDAFALLLESFEKVSGDERERLLDKQLWATAYPVAS